AQQGSADGAASHQAHRSERQGGRGAARVSTARRRRPLVTGGLLAALAMLAALAHEREAAGQSAAPPSQPAAHAAQENAARNDAAAQQELADRVDREVESAWQAEHLAPAAPASDAVWLRRLSVDLCGAIPQRDEVAPFLAAADDRERAARRARK